MGRYSPGHSTSHHCRRLCPDCYEISWTVDFYYRDSRQRFPRRFRRDTNEKGARKFCKKHGIAFPESPMLADITFQIVNGNRCHNGGVCFGYGDSDPYLVALGKKYVVTRQKGSRDWSGIGSVSYYAAEWCLARVEIVASDKFRVLEIIEQVTPGKDWRKTKANLLAKLRKLEGKEPWYVP